MQLHVLTTAMNTAAGLFKNPITGEPYTVTENNNEMKSEGSL